MIRAKQQRRCERSEDDAMHVAPLFRGSWLLRARVPGLRFHAIRTVRGLALLLTITSRALTLPLRLGLALPLPLTLPLSIPATARAMCPSSGTQGESCDTYHDDFHLIASA
jgi:hypothetical protein